MSCQQPLLVNRSRCKFGTATKNKIFAILERSFNVYKLNVTDLIIQNVKQLDFDKVGCNSN